jgi:HEAT repeat protein
MDLGQLADTVDTMIIQHNYPGFEPRALKLGLPLAAVNSSPKVFGAALQHKSVYVQLAALRWFQSHPGLVKGYSTTILKLLQEDDEYVRLEAIKTLECGGITDSAALHSLGLQLKDRDHLVRTAAAKALGKLLAKSDERNPEILALLKEAAADSEEQVRWKAQKALRKLGNYAGSNS